MEESLSFRDKLKLFEQKKIQYFGNNNPSKNLIKIKEFGKNNLVSGEIEENTKPEKANYKRIDKNLDKYCNTSFEILYFFQIFHYYLN